MECLGLRVRARLQRLGFTPQNRVLRLRQL